MAAATALKPWLMLPLGFRFRGFLLDRVTRKELRSDHFVLEVEHGVEYFGLHRSQFIRWGAIVLGVVVLIAAIFWYRSYQHGVREEALAAALQIQNATVGPQQNEFTLAYPSQTAKEQASSKAFSELASKYPGDAEGIIAEYYLATSAADKGDLTQAEKFFKSVSESSEKSYASLAKLSLATIYQSQGKLSDGEKLIRSVMDNPTVLVSKEEAIIALARLIGPTNSAEARKLLEPLRANTRSAVSRTALSALSDLSQK